ncbi:hypothetical protein N0V94_009102 [Neodidymelliopsis sp. IMI 364377]|nr:hypothetical protein N0V94_009102 [Neodidymelliopsis sp. IMI 364377]
MATEANVNDLELDNLASGAGAHDQVPLPQQAQLDDAPLAASPGSTTTPPPPPTTATSTAPPNVNNSIDNSVNSVVGQHNHSAQAQTSGQDDGRATQTGNGVPHHPNNDQVKKRKCSSWSWYGAKSVALIAVLAFIYTFVTWLVGYFKAPEQPLATLEDESIYCEDHPQLANGTVCHKIQVQICDKYNCTANPLLSRALTTVIPAAQHAYNTIPLWNLPWTSVLGVLLFTTLIWRFRTTCLDLHQRLCFGKPLGLTSDEVFSKFVFIFNIYAVVHGVFWLFAIVPDWSWMVCVFLVMEVWRLAHSKVWWESTFGNYWAFLGATMIDPRTSLHQHGGKDRVPAGKEHV